MHNRGGTRRHGPITGRGFGMGRRPGRDGSVARDSSGVRLNGGIGGGRR